MLISVYSHHFVVSGIDTPTKKATVIDFIHPLVKYANKPIGKGEVVSVMDRVFAAAPKNRSHYRLHINQLGEFKQFLGIRGVSYTEQDLKATEDQFQPVEHPIKQMYPPRPKQELVMKYLMDDTMVNKLVTLPPGYGKTYLALRYMWLKKYRALLTFKSSYTDRWISAITETFAHTPDDIFVVDSSKTLSLLMVMALNGDKIPAIIIIGFGLWRRYMEDYEESNGQSTRYPIAPPDFFVALGIQLKVVDEIHQEFHHNYKSDLYTNTLFSIGLSATMESSDPFNNRMYGIAFPNNKRCDGGGYDPHVKVLAWGYKIDPSINLRTQGQMGYSHNEFEKSLRRSRAYKEYFRMIYEDILVPLFYNVRQQGAKALVFFSQRVVCEQFTAFLCKRRPDLIHRKYTQEDSYNHAIEADVIISTVQSAGTAVDIPNLFLSVQTIAIDSRQSNEQVLGRTRPKKKETDPDCQFVYLVCENVQKHMQYHFNKKQFFSGRVLSHDWYSSGKVIGKPR